MKILFIHHGTIIGGAPLSLMYLVRELERHSDLHMNLDIASHSLDMRELFARNLTSTIRTWEDPCTFIGKYLIGYLKLDSWRGLKIFVKQLLRMPLSVWRQYHAIRRINPDIVHLNSSVLFTSAFAARLAHVKVVWHVREPIQGDIWKQQVSGWIIKRLAHRVIAISEVEASHLGRDLLNNIRIIYNPINMDTLQESLYDPLAERHKLGLDESDKVIVTLGGANPRKGALEQIEAMKYANGACKLVIAGPPLPVDSPNQYDQKMYKALGELPKGKVIFTGLLENVAPLLSACDVLTFTGMTPHFPRPVFEAWLMKKPVVVFDMEGISNQVSHEVDGIIVNEKTGYALGMALNKVLLDSQFMKKMGNVGRKKAEEKCNPISVARQVLSVYNEILS